MKAFTNCKTISLSCVFASVLLLSPVLGFAEEAAEAKAAEVECPEKEDVAMMGGMGMGMMGTGTGTGTGTMGTMGTMGGMGMGGMGMGMVDAEGTGAPEEEVKPADAIAHSPCSKNTSENQAK